MDLQRTTFSVRASMSLLSNSPQNESLEFSVVLADGSFVRLSTRPVSSAVRFLASAPWRLLCHFFLVFWTLRGGGAGSWAVIIDAALSTFPIFNATTHTVNILTTTPDQTASLMTTYLMHICDWDQVRAGQYNFTLTGSTTNDTLVVYT